QMALERRTLQVVDVLAEPGYQRSDAQQLLGFRTVLAVPMLREGTVVGAFSIYRTHVEAFTDRQIELVTTFADQAVIAIENTRLFHELQESNRSLREALEQQTAMGEILRVIASSPTDLQVVLDTIAESAARLCEANEALILRTDGGALRAVAAF